MSWFRSAVVYQIYPRSFADSDGDGIGDLGGIAAHLDHLAELGVDVLWLSPVYPSPQDDAGYDISDYQDIEPVFGTLAQFDELLAGVHARGMKLIMDLVVNHTSDEHPWFVESRSSKDNPKRDWYWWRSEVPERLALVLLRAGVGARRDHRRVLPAPVLAQAAGPQLGEPGGPRGDLRDDALVAGPGRRRLPDGRHQPDLQAARAARRQLVRAERARPAAPRVPAGDAPRGVRRARRPADRRRDAGRDRRGGAAVHRPGARARSTWSSSSSTCSSTRGRRRSGTSIPLQLRDLKASLGRWQDGLADVGWNSLYWNNHDQPRAVSRFGDDGEHRVAAAKMLATVLHLHRGTPYVYQGEELGMTNAPWATIDDFRDIESLNHYAEAVAGGESPDDVLRALRTMGRDNARTPVQWTPGRTPASRPASRGCRSTRTTPTINAEAERANPDSVFHHYRRVIELRHALPVDRRRRLHDAARGRRARLRVRARAGRRRAARARQLQRRRGHRPLDGWDDAEASSGRRGWRSGRGRGRR